MLLAEQGLGDTVHFVRYAPLVAALGARVILDVQAPLRAVAATVPGVALVLGDGEPLPQVDFHCPLLSLPLGPSSRPCRRIFRICRHRTSG